MRDRGSVAMSGNCWIPSNILAFSKTGWTRRLLHLTVAKILGYMSMSTSLAHKRIEVSLVIPTYNERENIGSLLQQVYVVLKETGRSFEVIVVDDDSPDGTW